MVNKHPTLLEGGEGKGVVVFSNQEGEKRKSNTISEIWGKGPCRQKSACHGGAPHIPVSLRGGKQDALPSLKKGRRGVLFLRIEKGLCASGQNPIRR